MSSVLETFLIMFSSDTTELKTGTEEAKKVTSGLDTSLKNTNITATKVGGSFLTLAKQAAGALVAFASIGAIVGGVRSAVAFADRLDELSKGLNINIEDLSAWGDAVHLNGGSAEEFQGTVKGLTASLSAFATKGRSLVAPFFKELGIKMVDAKGKARNVMDILPELADAFQKLSKEESFGMGQKLGLDQGTIMLLQQGRREVDLMIARQRELGVVTKEDAEIAAKFNDQWDETAHAFRTLFLAIGSSVLPIFTAVLKAFEKMVLFVKKHSTVVQGVLIGLGIALLVFVVPSLLATAAAAIMATLPFLLLALAIGAAIAVFAIIYDEIMNFIAGNKSMIGYLLEKYPLLKTMFEGLKAWVAGVGEAFEEMADTVTWAWNVVVEAIKHSLNFIFGSIDRVMNAYKKVKSFVGFGDDDTSASQKEVEKYIIAGKGALDFTGRVPLAPPGLAGKNVNNRSTSVQIGKVEVNTQATDAQGIAGAIGASMNTQMRQTINNFDDGVAA